MFLTREEKEMLEGQYGLPVQKCMEVLVALGECYDAERMIPVTSAHLLRIDSRRCGRAHVPGTIRINTAPYYGAPKMASVGTL